MEDEAPRSSREVPDESPLVDRVRGARIAVGAEDADASRSVLERSAERSGPSIEQTTEDALTSVRRHPPSFPAEVAAAYADLGAALSADPGPDLLRLVTALAVDRVAGADWASITMRRDQSFTSVAATGPPAEAADRRQYSLGEGPCVDVIRSDTAAFFVRDLDADDRWTRFGPPTAQSGIRAMLSYRLGVDAREPATAALNIYAAEVDAFDDHATVVGTLLAAHAGRALLASYWNVRSKRLEHAVESNRSIGVAMGILMQRHLITQDRAFALLRGASQHRNRKLRDIAEDVIDTGTLELPAEPHG